MRPISTNNDSSRHEQQQRPPIPRRFSKTNDISANDDCKRAHQTDSEGGCVTTEQPAAKYGARQSPTYNHALSSPM
ncbi:hypothetical protein SNOG_01372 [Parastagonospora nodorum SN15]|uniref:Uncharacterized protein n=1 Tax=Phaeosphaeria nodorum (strain SN15 / ATCC MYA-4574 / FGSC 10173) TaxID=321614 RepID=Q0V3P2_PHANO|nr:hypothetical protein SNOG_01372 [Parastagonospora nodorum SN15]EAT91021.1 hypothetical protein SNOG_01372 [Parastagonospora nodorum SN15]